MQLLPVVESKNETFPVPSEDNLGLITLGFRINKLFPFNMGKDLATYSCSLLGEGIRRHLFQFF